uniref:Uncharacterized protein n=1 Tax=Nicotiana tabacum TaxID=4097 RepID=A0A1S4BIL2_TOBAC|nr:PREDICTED: uncharacterized protein LOC107808690 [Nicotiana tabacum]
MSICCRKKKMEELGARLFSRMVIGEISVAGATYKTMEFVGTAVERLTTGSLTFQWIFLVEWKKTSSLAKEHLSCFLVTGQDYLCVMNLSTVMSTPGKPLVFSPHSPDNRVLARKCKDVKIDKSIYWILYWCKDRGLQRCCKTFPSFWKEGQSSNHSLSLLLGRCGWIYVLFQFQNLVTKLVHRILRMPAVINQQAEADPGFEGCGCHHIMHTVYMSVDTKTD